MRAKQENSQMMMSEFEQRQAEYELFKAKRREEGLKIVAETAETTWWHTQVLDPYHFLGELLPRELHCIGRSYFARNPESDIWVEFGDLPDETRDKLHRRPKSAFDDLIDETWDPFEPRPHDPVSNTCAERGDLADEILEALRWTLPNRWRLGFLTRIKVILKASVLIWSATS
jgi:hypothetical protein